jgi:phage tail-like protein
MKFESRAWAGRLLMVAIAVVAVVAVNGQSDQRKAPFGAYYFEVEIGGVQYSFRSASGLKIETEVIEFQEGNGDIIRKLAGPTRYSNIRLSRAFTGERSLYEWYVKTQKPQPIKVDGRITMFDRHGAPVATWNFVNSFPTKWEGPDLDASASEVAIETIEIAHEGLTLDDDDDEK